MIMSERKTLGRNNRVRTRRSSNERFCVRYNRILVNVESNHNINVHLSLDVLRARVQNVLYCTPLPHYNIDFVCWNAINIRYTHTRFLERHIYIYTRRRWLDIQTGIRDVVVTRLNDIREKEKMIFKNILEICSNTTPVKRHRNGLQYALK